MIALLRAGHLQPTLAVSAVTTALAISVGRGVGAVAVAAATVSGQLSVGWSNDYFDRHRDHVAGRQDKPIVAGQVEAHTVGRAAAAAMAVCVPLSLLSGWASGVVHLGAVGMAWLYNLGLKATVASPIAYIVAFASLPAVVTLGLDGHPMPPLWAIAGAALLGCGAHFVNTLADIDDDIRAGVMGLPQRLGARTSLRVGTLLLAAAGLLFAVAPAGHPGVGMLAMLALQWVLVGAVLVAARMGRSRDAWSLTIGTAVAAVVLLLANGRALT